VVFDVVSLPEVAATRVQTALEERHTATPVMTMVDEESWVVSPSHFGRCAAYRLVPERGGLRAVAENDVMGAIAAATGVGRTRVIETGDEREQWADAANVLALRPGVVIAYDRNVTTNDALERNGITVLPTPSAELSRGRGGPRCLSCPLLRAS
jgi:arginine deiminase